jgi:hypothetical protein
MKTFLPFRRVMMSAVTVTLAAGILYSCTKSDSQGDFDVKNSLTLFKLDNVNNALDLKATDTVLSQAGVTGKYILVSGATGAQKGLDSIRLGLYAMDGTLLNGMTLSSFYKPEYHLINTQLMIPPTKRGQVYRVQVEVIDKTGEVVGTSSFIGQDVVTCDPLPPCIVNNQITVMIETPAGTPDESLYLFGSLNGWSRGDVNFELHKNPDVPNCYCVTIPFPPGYSDWQVNEVYVTRGEYSNDAVNPDGSSFIVQYTTTEMGPIWKVKVPKWRDQ